MGSAIMDTLLPATCVLLLISVAEIRGAHGEAFARQRGLLNNGFTVPNLPGEQPSTTSFTVVPSYSFQFASTSFTTVEIHKNGYIRLDDGTNPNALVLDPTDLTLAANNGKLFIIAPLMVPTTSTASYTYRLVGDCTQTVVGKEYWGLDCFRVRSELARILQENPDDLTDPVSNVLIVTWQLNIGTQADYVQALLVTTTGGATYVLFVYQTTPYSFTGSASRPAITLMTGTTADRVAFQQNSASIEFDAFTSTLGGDLSAYSPTTAFCGNPGILSVQTDSLSTGATTIALDIPKDSCTESVFCSIDAAGEITASFTFLYPRDQALLGVGASGATMPGCSGQIDAAGLVAITGTGADLSTNCEFTYDAATGALSGSFLVLKDPAFTQQGDFKETFTCYVNDIPDSVTEAFSVGPISSVVVPTVNRQVELSIVRQTGPSAAEVTSCTLGENLFLQLSYTPDPSDNLDILPYGVYGTTCTFYNYDPETTAIPLPSTIVGSYGLDIAPVSLETITNGCPTAARAGKAFEQKAGFTVASNIAPFAPPFISQTGGFKCAGFLGTQTVWASCELHYCTDVTTDTLCIESCPAARRRRRAIPDTSNTTRITTSFTVIEGDDKTGTDGNCVDSTAAIGTIVGLILGLILVSGISVGAFVKLVLRPESRRKSVN